MPTTPELTAYIAAGGQLSGICGNIDGDSAPVTVDCEACRISNTSVLIQDSRPRFVQTTATRTFEFIAKRVAERNDLDPARLTRDLPHA